MQDINKNTVLNFGHSKIAPKVKEMTNAIRLDQLRKHLSDTLVKMSEYFQKEISGTLSDTEAKLNKWYRDVTEKDGSKSYQVCLRQGVRFLYIVDGAEEVKEGWLSHPDGSFFAENEVGSVFDTLKSEAEAGTFDGVLWATYLAAGGKDHDLANAA